MKIKLFVVLFLGFCLLCHAQQEDKVSIGGKGKEVKPVAIAGYDGAAWLVFRIANTSKDLNAVTITTIATVWTPASGKKFRVMGGTISVSAGMNVLFEDNAASAFVFRTPTLAANTSYTFVVQDGQGKLSAVANNVLKATGSAAGTITGTIYGTEE